MNFKRGWLITVKPKDNELLSSWLIRTALENGDEPLGWTKNIWGNWRSWTIDIDRHCPPEKIKTLSNASGLSEKRLISMTLQSNLSKILKTRSIATKSSWPWVIPTGKRNRTPTNGLHYCPICLKSNKTTYLKKDWRLAWNVACSDHKKLLALSCPSCSSSFSPHLVTYQKPFMNKCTNCSYDLSNVVTRYVDVEVLEFQEILNRSLLNKSHQSNKYPIVKTFKELFEVTLYFMKFFYLIRRFETINEHLMNYLDLSEESKKQNFAPKTNVEALPVDNRQFLLLSTSRLLKLPMSTIVTLLQESKVTQQKFNGSKTQSIIIKKIGSQLQGKVPKKITRISKTIIIEPNTKQEVEHLMDDIRPFL